MINSLPSRTKRTSPASSANYLDCPFKFMRRAYFLETHIFQEMAGGATGPLDNSGFKELGEIYANNNTKNNVRMSQERSISVTRGREYMGGALRLRPAPFWRPPPHYLPIFARKKTLSNPPTENTISAPPRSIIHLIPHSFTFYVRPSVLPHLIRTS